jgi:carboxypeptidase family protein
MIDPKISSQLKIRSGVALIFLLFLMTAPMVRAQVTASLLGTATDSSLSALPGVSVTVTNVDTNVSQHTQTDAVGQYRFLALPVGRYRLEATVSGFQRFVAADIVLTVNEQRRLDLVFQVGSLEQSVEVTANPVQVETTSTQLGQVIDSSKMLSLPLNGRSYMDLLALQAGVVQTGTNNQTGNPNASVNGQRGTANSFMVNGGDVGEGRGFGAALIPNLDSVAEFRLITNSFDAEYGRFSGAVMNAITKGGTNAIHGSLFEFLRNKHLDSRGFFDPQRADLKRNQFGYAVGGPLLKNKLFWFTDYQGTREVQGVGTGLINVPSAAQRSGNIGTTAMRNNVNGSYWASVLSQRLGYTVTNGMPYTTATCTSTATCVFPGGIIPERAFSPAARGTLKYIALPNNGPNLYVTSNANRTLRDDKAGQRADFFNEKTGNWFVYYHFADQTATNPLGGSQYGGFPTTTPRRTQQAVLSNTYTFGPTAVNEARISFFRTSSLGTQYGDAGGSVADLGFVRGVGTLGIVPSGPPGWESVPNISITDFSSFGRGGSTLQANNTWHATENFSKIVNRHAFRFGVEARYLQVNARNTFRLMGNTVSTGRKPVTLFLTSCLAPRTNTFRPHNR